MKELRGAVAVVTGAGSGIGRALPECKSGKRRVLRERLKAGFHTVNRGGTDDLERDPAEPTSHSDRRRRLPNRPTRTTGFVQRS
jgi:hypothetical protein